MILEKQLRRGPQRRSGPRRRDGSDVLPTSGLHAQKEAA